MRTLGTIVVRTVLLLVALLASTGALAWQEKPFVPVVVTPVELGPKGLDYLRTAPTMTTISSTTTSR